MIGEADLKGFEYSGASPGHRRTYACDEGTCVRCALERDGVSGGKSRGSKKVETINDIAANPFAWPLIWAGYGFAIATVATLAYTSLMSPPKDDGD